MARGNGTVGIAYGKGRISLRMDPKLAEWRVIEPRFEAALETPEEQFQQACRAPIGARPLRELVSANDRVVIVTSDGTRPVPNRQLIPWILNEIPASPENVTVLLGTGTHRPNTPEEIDAMFGPEVARRVRIVNHSAFDRETNTQIGTTPSGGKIIVDRAYLEADKRIVVGFIEPHFFAGFSGGAKGVIPGVGGIDTILHLHSHRLIADPKSAYGILDGNPIQAEIAEMVGNCPPDFMVNVTLNGEKKITAFFCGDYREAHRAGCARVKTTAMAPVEHEFPIVVTSNSGFPLDQNLYQTVKGMSAAARIVQERGTMFVASECSDGIPSHGNFGQIMAKGESPKAIADWIERLEAPMLDQWQAQILSNIRMRCEVAIQSQLSAPVAESCMLRPVDDLQSAVEAKIREIGVGAPVAVLPEGPLSIPYVAAGTA